MTLKELIRIKRKKEVTLDMSNDNEILGDGKQMYNLYLIMQNKET